MKLNDIKSDLVKQYYLAMFIGSDKSGLYSEIEKKKALEWLTKLMLDKKKSKVLLENIKKIKQEDVKEIGEQICNERIKLLTELAKIQGIDNYKHKCHLCNIEKSKYFIKFGMIQITVQKEKWGIEHLIVSL